jgi:hypothetical protein
MTADSLRLADLDRDRFGAALDAAIALLPDDERRRVIESLATGRELNEPRFAYAIEGQEVRWSCAGVVIRIPLAQVRRRLDG